MKRRILWGALCLVALIAGTGAYWVVKVGRSVTGSGGSIIDGFRAVADPKKMFPGQDRITILVLGRDYDRDRKGMPHTKHSRADTIMLLSVDLNSKSLAALSIPRDTKVTAPDGQQGKINGVLARGGVDLMKQTLQQSFGVYVDYHVLLKPDAVRSIVDALGGVEVETIDEMHYDDDWGQLHIHLPKGQQRLDGKQAEGFVRFRKSDPAYARKHKGPNLEEGDFRRAARQQQLISAMIASGTSPANIWKADQIIDTGFKQIETSLSRLQIVALGNLLKNERSQMISATLPGEDQTLGGAYYWNPDMDRSLKMIAWILRRDILAGRSVTKVAVYNATKTAGVAKALAAQLYTQGFDASSAGNSKDSVERTMVMFHRALHEAHAREVADLIGATSVVKEPIDPRNTWGPDISVKIGPELAATLVPAQPKQAAQGL